MSEANQSSRIAVQRWGLFAGPALALVVYLALPDAGPDAGGAAFELGHPGRATAAIGTWMAIWWMSEAIPVYATALLPLALLPLTGATTLRLAATPYGHELIFLFMGGFIIALAVQRWGLHERVALTTLRFVGTRPDRIVGAFMGISAGLSMWVSNTATTIMLLPIALSVIGLTGDGEGDPAGAEPDTDTRNLALCLLLGIAYAASVGGLGTLIGTPPNLFMASYVREHLGGEISFVRWMAVGLPLVVVFLPLVWWVLTHVVYPIRASQIRGVEALVRSAGERLGPVSRGERATAAVFAMAALGWLFRPLLVKVEIAGLRPLAGLSDTGVAMLAALALFVIPVDAKRRVFVMDWDTAAKLPWGVLVLFGGGLSLAAAIRSTGVSAFLGAQLGGLGGAPPWLIVLGVTALVIFLTELTSNTATTVTLIPILAELGIAVGVPPIQLIVPATLAASCAFMLPVATPPNAVVFGSGRVSIPQMMRGGLWLNLIGIALITAIAWALVLPVLGRLPPAG